MSETIEEILAVAEDPAYHRVATARIAAVPQALRDEHAELEALLPTLVTDTIDAHPDRVATAERLAAIEAEMEAAVIEFRFRSIGHRAWADLLRAHPPTKDQLARDKRLDHNPDTFPHVAMAASCVEPEMSAEQVKRLELSAFVDVRAWNELWSACLTANVTSPIPKSIAASLLLKNGESLRRPTTTEFPGASSSDES